MDFFVEICYIVHILSVSWSEEAICNGKNACCFIAHRPQNFPGALTNSIRTVWRSRNPAFAGKADDYPL
jgi:hypothetical protein